MFKKAITLFLVSTIALSSTAQAQMSIAHIPHVPTVEWYPVENEKSPQPQRTTVILSGRTTPGSIVQIDGETVTVLRNKKASTQKIENAKAKANAEGFFEVSVDLPFGSAQIPVLISTSEKSEKTFLLTFEVSPVKEQIVLNTPTTNRKPPAAAKRVRLWMGAGFTQQKYTQSITSGSDLGFQTIQAPGIMARGGYWGERWGFDFYFRDAPGKIEAEAPYTVLTSNYSWRITEFKGLYQIDRNAKSRIFGLASQWQFRFGMQMHQLPFLEVSPTQVVSLETASLRMASLGVGLLLAQEQDWTYEFFLGLQRPLSASGPGDSFQISSPMAFEVQLGSAYKFAPNWRLGLFSHTQSLSYSYEYSKNGAPTSGKQSLFSTTLDLRLGYEF